MDRSYLSDPEVVAASRSFVCVRLVTFEDVNEMEFMNSIYEFRTPTKNSLFAILDPAAKEHLVTPGRSMAFTFDDAAHMASRMNEISEGYPDGRTARPAELGLPYLKNVRLAMNVAACDTQCLVILFAPKASQRRRLESLLLPLAWQEGLIGEYLFTVTDNSADLDGVAEAGDAPGLLVVVPDAYGLKARRVAFLPLGTNIKDARAVLIATAEANRMGSKDSKRHIGRGRREGVQWEKLLEDPGPSRGSRGRRTRRKEGDGSADD